MSDEMLPEPVVDHNRGRRENTLLKRALEADRDRQLDELRMAVPASVHKNFVGTALCQSTREYIESLKQKLTEIDLVSDMIKEAYSGR